MKLSSIHLEPFAGLSKRTVVFDVGLNVILGPNEAGKSTLVNALKLSLFTPTKIGKRVFESEVQRFMPITGGDTIQTKLEFALKGDDYVLEKSWGAQQTSRLTLPGGELYTDPSTVQEELEKYLSISPATWNQVLFAFQSRLADTLDELLEDAGPQQDLADLLRQAVFETDGVRVEDLGDAIYGLDEKSFGRWDQDLGRPQDNRGVENPWKKSVGSILKAYYEMSAIEKKLEETLSIRLKMDELTTQLQKSKQKIGKLNKYIEKNKEFVNTARDRDRIEANLDARVSKIRAISKTAREWPKNEDQIEILGIEKADITPALKAVEAEKKLAQTFDAQKDTVRIIKKAEPKNSEYKEQAKKHGKLKVVTDQEVDALTDLETQIGRIRAQMSGGKVSLELHAKKDMEVKLAKGMSAGRSKKVAAGKTIAEKADGEISLEHKDWDLLVRSGDVPFGALEANIAELEAELNDLLGKVKCSSIKTARNAHAKFVDSIRVLEEKQRSLDDALEGEDLEELKTSLADIAVEEPERSLADVVEELGIKKARLEQVTEEITRLKGQITEWCDEHGSLEGLKEGKAKLEADKDELEEKLTQLAPLPARIKDTNKFVSDFEGKQYELTQAKDAHADLREEIAGLRGNMPDESEEELANYVNEAREVFERKLSEGEAIELIREVFNKLEDEMDSSTMKPWVDSLSQVIKPLTVGRYDGTSDLDNDELVARRKDGVDVPIDLLSEGTKVGIGLAIRLAMAGYFLKDRKGFLVMDDPLVDLDPERQKAAAEVVKKFAEDKQVIVLTCQPTHAEMLDGHRIDLDPLVV